MATRDGAGEVSAAIGVIASRPFVGRLGPVEAAPRHGVRSARAGSLNIRMIAARGQTGAGGPRRASADLERAFSP